ncbi:MAG TPA: DUF2938 domain-containing protein [Brevundimonas sp.]|nr:DUF2938 domain-containing protein [Brevundimonas sp.]
MAQELEFVMRATLIGVGATVVMDLWAIVLKRVFGTPSLNYAMVGRWIGHLHRGRFTHAGIAQSAPVRGERIIGWSAHYAIGVIFAAGLLAIWGLDWAHHPTMAPALIVGVATVAAPFLILQPCMGAGIAASKTPQPNTARRRSLMAHTAFGVGLYVSALLFAALIPSGF